MKVHKKTELLTQNFPPEMTVLQCNARSTEFNPWLKTYLTKWQK